MTPGARDWAAQTSPAAGDDIAEDPIVMLPIGSVEQHGRHLPLGTDSFAAEAVARAAAHSWSGEHPLLLLPTIWTGLSPHHMGLPGSITLRADTLIAVIEDVCSSLLQQGVRRILLLNAHGGNVAAIDVAMTKLGARGLDTERIAALTYWRLLGDEVDGLRDSAPGGTGHAGEFETSLMLATHAGAVELAEAKSCYPKQSAYLSTDLFASAPVKRYLPFDRLSPTGTLGDPGHASTEKGERILAACAAALRRFLEDFAAW